MEKIDLAEKKLVKTAEHKEKLPHGLQTVVAAEFGVNVKTLNKRFHNRMKNPDYKPKKSGPAPKIDEETSKIVLARIDKLVDDSMSPTAREIIQMVRNLF